MTNPKVEYNTFIRANLPTGMSYDETRNRYVVNGKYRFPTYLQAKWYLDYITKFGFIPEGVFDPATLFANGEEGAWYEPSTTTAFLSTTDLTPCGYGDACGFLLDKSQSAGYSGGSFTGLGSELVENGDFATNDLTGWTDNGIGVYTLDASSGSLSLVGTSSSDRPILAQQLTAEAGEYLLVSMDINMNSGLLVFVMNDTGLVGGQFFELVISQSGPLEFVVRSDIANPYLVFFNGLPGTCDAVIDNISVKELPGNHATQATFAARPILARVPEGGRRNLLEYTEEFDNAIWVKTSGSVVANQDGAADEFIEPSSGSSRVEVSQVAPAANSASGTTYAFSAKFKAVPGEPQRYLYIASTSVSFGSQCVVGVDPVTGSIVFDNGNGGTPSVSGPDGDGYYRLTITDTATASNADLRFIIYGSDSTSGAANYSCTGASIAYVKEAQLEEGSTATAYQKVVSEYDVTEDGVTSLDYLSFDGTDDAMATAAIDFTGTDEMSVFAASTRRNAEGDTAALLELSAESFSNAGTFAVFIPRSTDDFSFRSKGSLEALASVDGYTPPTTNVITGLGEISSDTCILRIDGSQVSSSTDNQGTGNFGNYALFIGARSGGALPVDGDFYGLIVRGVTSTNQEISDTESYLAGRVGFTAPTITGVPTIGVS